VRPFKVRLVGLGDEVVPAWLPEVFAAEGIDFLHRECTTEEDLARHAADADLVWVWGSGVITAERLSLLEKCGAILRSGSGVDNVPVAEATRRNVLICNTPLAAAEEVSDHAIALLFTMVRQTAAQDRLVRRGIWERRIRKNRWHLRGSTLGILGFGHIARLVARKISGFNLRILAYDPFLPPERIAAGGATPVGLDELLSRSDFLTLHTPLVDGTRHLIDERALRLMKPRAILINTSRGGVIDEAALIRALQEGWIGGAGLDVFEREPISPDNPLLTMENVVLTPHIAGYSDIFHDGYWRYSVETAIALADGKWPRSPLNRAGITPRWQLADVEWSDEPKRYAYESTDNGLRLG
jgi:D-3-phosphoglycerate dehydrogenase